MLKSFLRSLTMMADGLVVVGKDAEIERIVVVEDPDFGIVGRGLDLPAGRSG